MGIYSSGLSCWERRQRGLANDNAGPETIDAVETVEVKPVKDAEVKGEAKVETKFQTKVMKKIKGEDKKSKFKDK